MITKTLTGVPFFDEHYGGIYRGRTMLVSGKSGSGKTVFGLQFIRQAIKQNERCLILSGQPMNDLLIFAEALKLPLSDAVEAGNLILLEYHNYIPIRDSEEYITLPPDGFLQFKEIIDAHAIQRIVLDTVLPWVSIRPQTNLAEHVYSFVRAFERIGVTTLMTIPKPASLPSTRLKNALEEVAPVSVTLANIPHSNDLVWITNKYLGEMKLDKETPYQITPGLGIALKSGAVVTAAGPVAPAPAPARPRAEAADASPNRKIKFSDIVATQTRGPTVKEKDLLSWLEKPK